MTRFDQVHNRQYTDLAVVMGPTVRWTLADYDDLQEHAPEVLLGYRVRLTTPEMVHHRLRGLVVSKVVLLDSLDTNPRAHYAVNELLYFVSRAVYPKVEWYDVHRGLDPVVKLIREPEDIEARREERSQARDRAARGARF